jgi:putative membrane protein
MSNMNSLALTVLLGAASVTFAQNQTQPPAGDPSSASSPHQREATKQTGTAEAPANASPEAASAASPHQQEAVDGKKMKRGAGEAGAADPATFVKKAALGGMTEVAASKLAVTKAQDPEVRSFAQKMVTDHTAANEELKSLAEKKGWMVPTSLDAKHEAIVQKLSSKSGADFDAAYSKQMMKDHEKTVSLFKGATRSSDTDLAAWAQKTLPKLEQHEQLAAKLPAERSHSASASQTPPRQ